MADAMKRTDPRAPLLRQASVQLKAWEIHLATEAKRAPAPPPTPEVVNATCGLCGHEGPRLGAYCTECSERW